MKANPAITLAVATALALLAGCSAPRERQPEARIIKVLPSLLDTEGRASLHPSLYERDAYQALLRAESKKVGGLRFDVLWKTPGNTTQSRPLVLKLELRRSAHGTNATAGNVIVVERPFPASLRGRTWSRIVLGPEEFRSVGEVSAWRATLVRDQQALASTQSFLW